MAVGIVVLLTATLQAGLDAWVLALLPGRGGIAVVVVVAAIASVCAIARSGTGGGGIILPAPLGTGGGDDANRFGIKEGEPCRVMHA